MVEHYKQLTRQFNSLREKKRYKEKRERRAYLTEAYLDGELALYKPTHIPYKVYTDFRFDKKLEEIKVKNLDNDMLKVLNNVDKIVGKKERTTTYNWFEKFLLWIKNIFK